MFILTTVVGAWSCAHAPKTVKSTSAMQSPATEQVRLRGPSSIRPDGSIRTRQANRPDGHLLMSNGANSVPREQVEPWARNQVVQAAASSGLAVSEVTGWITIKGPRRLQTEDGNATLLYDVEIEVWKLSSPPRVRQRDVY
ncbi:MAG: hypothetical protein CMJ29_10820 [Phycisphaerae bacterium]|nr:hypothetical protein [Phycisphaerae bacterium]MAT82119.1 hypothetical protein [Phycisphaerae bacterium]